MNKNILNIFVMLMLFSGVVMADGVASLKAFFNNTSSMRANFHQIVNDNQGRKVQEVEGTMQLKRPNKFRWDYNEPYEQQIISDGKQVFLYDVELEQVTVRGFGKALGTSPAALLAGGAGVEKNFKLEDAGTNNGLEWVVATPKAEDSGFERILLGFKGEKLRSMELHDSFSHVTHIAFDKVERNPSLKDSAFLFVPPEGVDVVGE